MTLGNKIKTITNDFKGAESKLIGGCEQNICL